DRTGYDRPGGVDPAVDVDSAGRLESDVRPVAAGEHVAAVDLAIDGDRGGGELESPVIGNPNSSPHDDRACTEVDGTGGDDGHVLDDARVTRAQVGGIVTRDLGTRGGNEPQEHHRCDGERLHWHTSFGPAIPELGYRFGCRNRLRRRPMSTKILQSRARAR